MALFRTSKPNVKAVARRGDAEALVAAAGYQDLIPAPGGGTIDRGAEVRQEAILALGGLGADVGADAVAAALSDPSDHVRLAAIRVLFARRQSTPLAAALAWLPRDGSHARPLAIKALAELRQAGSAPAVTAALVHAQGDDPVDEAGAELLTLLLEADEGSESVGEVVEQLLTALADQRDAVSDRAKELLALVGPASTEGVIAELKAGAAPHRAVAVPVRTKDARALEPLMEALRHRDARVRAESAEALGELRDPAAVEALIQATRDSDHRVRTRAGSALNQLGMVALVVGVSTMVRTVIFEAVASADVRPGLPEAAKGSSGNGGGALDESAPGATSPTPLGRLLAGLEDGGEASEGES